MGFFNNIKNIIFAIFSILGGLYMVKLKYNAYTSQDKLKDIELKIAKSNIKIIKETAKLKAEGKNIETETEIANIKKLKSISKKIAKEMEEIEKTIHNTKNKTFSIEV